MTTESRITYLAETYQLCICGDHHKDRDCHWYIEQVWSYGDDPKWRVKHYGYHYKEISVDCDNYEQALWRLEVHLISAINQEVEYCQRVVRGFDGSKNGFFDYTDYDFKRAKEILNMLEERGYFESK